MSHTIKFKDDTARTFDTLRGANLRWANLRGADLCDAIFPKDFRIARLDFGGWPVTVTPTHTSIGCQRYSNEDWLKWSPSDVKSMDSKAEKWWSEHQDAVRAVIKDVMR